MKYSIKNKTSVILAFSVLLFGANLSAQDTLSQVFRPRIGLGTGVMTYYGEVQNYQKGFSHMVNRFGGLVYANAPITKYLNVEFTASYAKIAANERSLIRNYNFESRIRMGSAQVYYNFYPFLRPNRNSFHPFIGAGIASFEFLSKTDLYDADGNEYFYWSDGSIMDMEEDDPLAATDAVPLQRDYTYETDLRSLNSDDLGKYKEQSFAFPLTLGVEWHLSPRWDFRISTTYYFTRTDLVDNVSNAGEGIRKGDINNDRFMFTSVSLSYDLKLPKEGVDAEGPLVDEDGIELYAGYDPSDFDQDGVIDALDNCPQTPLEALVDEYGCPLDEDGDGVPDYRDDELGTPEGNYVDEFGVTLTEEDLANHLRLFYDSTGYEHDFVEVRTEVILEGKGTGSKTDHEGKEGFRYVIIVGKEQKDVAVNDLHKFLGYEDYSTVVRNDTIYYTIGSYDNIADAVAAKTSLEDNGVAVSEIARNNEKTNSISTVDDKVIEKVGKINLISGTESKEFGDGSKMYRVQLGAFRNDINVEKVFPGMEIVRGENTDGINRFYTTSFDSYEEADKFRAQADKNGYPGAFVVAYSNQKRITLKEAGIEPNSLPEDYDENSERETFIEDPKDTQGTDNDNTNSSVDLSLVKYRVELAHIEGEVPVEIVDVLYNIGAKKIVPGEDGSIKYYSQSFETAEERDKALEEFKNYGLDSLKPVVEYKGVFYSTTAFKKLSQQ